MLGKVLYVVIFLFFSTLFCCSGYDYNNEFNVPPYAPPLSIAMDLSLCITIYIAYSTLLIYRFSALGIAGIAVALLTHFLFLRSQKQRRCFINWCIPTYGGWALIYTVLYLFVNKGN